jgi:hypothetical protein
MLYSEEERSDAPPPIRARLSAHFAGGLGFAHCAEFFCGDRAGFWINTTNNLVLFIDKSSASSYS